MGTDDKLLLKNRISMAHDSMISVWDQEDKNLKKNELRLVTRDTVKHLHLSEAKFLLIVGKECSWHTIFV